MSSLGKILIIAGIVSIIVGIILLFAGDKLNWFGNLPGDIKIEKGNTRIYFPLTTMIILSVVLSLVMWIIRKFF
ncbi:MAG TPA: DUF2905 domain-containing protein [Bacteroidales bacterium]|jgi:H+/Cl- antiporter ClcA|nr:DUF2905 domain-containing protein [Bacteroidales bacterium]